MRRVAAALLCALWLPACATWSRTRVEVIDPIHALLHHDYPSALEAMDRRHLAELFAADAPGEATAPTWQLLDAFSRIDDARAHIERVHLGEEPVRAEVTLRVDGVGRQGRRRTLWQDKHWTLARTRAGWRIAADRPTPLREAPTPPVVFADETLLRGLWFQHESARIPDPDGVEQKYIYGSGVAAADFDGDGWDDVFLLSSDRIELFRNVAGEFVQVSHLVGLGRPLGRILTVALPLDVDNDGDPDLFVGAEQGQPLLLRNEGGTFVPIESGIRSTRRTVGAVAGDFDGDGSVDLFLANHEDVFWNAPDPPGAADNARPDQLFLNDGRGVFHDATELAGVGNTGWSLAPAAADYDGDGDLDLFVGNDFGLDALYRNDGSARFEEVSAEAGVDLPVASMSADWGDFDGDGDLDLFVGGMLSGSAWVLEAPGFPVRRVPPLVDWLFRPYVRAAIRAWFRGNRFYENLGDGSFREISAESGARNSGWAWASVWLDFDNDGRLDVYSANGFLSGPLEDDL